MARILIIDDQKIPRVATARTLSDAGHEVETAPDGPEGIRKAGEWAPDVIVLDVNMPGMDGFEVVRHLKGDERTEPIPVIFLTGTSSSDTLVARGLQLGAYDFLSKGCSREELLARVGVMTRIKRSNDELSAIARIAETLIQSLDPDDLAQRFLGQTCDVFRADAAVLTHASPDDEIHRRYVRGLKDVDDPLIDTLPDSIATCLPEGNDAAILTVDQIPGPAGAFLRRNGFSSAAAACLRHEERPATVLTVLSRRREALQRDADAPLLQLLVGQVNIALDNASLHTRTRQQAGELEQAMGERSRFFASMSHELRTPINAVVGYAELLQEGTFGPVEEAQDEALDRINRSARHLLELINDILDISKLEAGKVGIVPEPVELSALIEDTATSIQLMAEEKGLRLVLDHDRPVTAHTDPARVRQILLNLMANAVKFTDEGEVRVSLAATEAAPGEQAPPHRALIRVQDTGPGISPDHLERIFEEFEQVGHGSSGTGLGLPISRRLAELLGGDLKVESEVGSGSTFTLVLPAEAPVPAAGG